MRLHLFALAYDLDNFLRRLALPRRVSHWSLTTLREKLVKIGAKVARRARPQAPEVPGVGCIGWPFRLTEAPAGENAVEVARRGVERRSNGKFRVRLSEEEFACNSASVGG